MRLGKYLLVLWAGLVSMSASGQENSYVHSSPLNGYIAPSDPAVQQKLDRWQDLKFGVLFHWGLYSIPGICESWQICSEDWITRPKGFTYEEYKRWYWGLNASFNPVAFDPGQWADVMQDAGMRYMVFTTKHHDGFCMYDSKYTDFSCAHAPLFEGNEKSDIARHVFSAFREKGFWIGCYFSKPDWHHQGFWNDYYGCAGRGRNYKLDSEEHRGWWEEYRQFCKNQLLELTQDYGHLDILWLDGGWVRAEDVYLEEVLQQARNGEQAGLISVDRAMRSQWENYQTPERTIPEVQLDYPWESCITLGQNWGWDPAAKFKSPEQIIGLLGEICAKGGCFLLGIGPTPQGLIQPEVVEVLKPVGEWLRDNGEAIYETRGAKVYVNEDKSVWFTASKDGKVVYAIVPRTEGNPLASLVTWEGNIPLKGSKIIDLATRKSCRYEVQDGKVVVTLPTSPKIRYGVALKVVIEK